jgi:hypothetical protein
LQATQFWFSVIDDFVVCSSARKQRRVRTPLLGEQLTVPEGKSLWKKDEGSRLEACLHVILLLLVHQDHQDESIPMPERKMHYLFHLT